MRSDYWVLSFVLGLAPGDADELVPLLEDIEPDDGVDDELDEPADGDVPAGLEDELDVEPVPEDVEPDDIEPADEPVVDGGVVFDDDDEDGDGVTVGGDVDDVFDSR